MIKFKDLLKENQSKKMIVYHGTNVPFKKFNLEKSTQGIIWFTSNKEKILSKEVGASGHGYVLTCEVDIKNPAGWKEYDKYLLDQLTNMGYDGVILPSSYGFDGFVFSPQQIKILKIEKVDQNIKENNDASTFQMYHGGTKWSRLPTELRGGTKGRYEGGVGLYFTNSYETARSYAKGSKVVQLVDIDKNYKDIKNIMVPLEDVVNFVQNVRGMKNKKEIINSLTNLSNRLGTNIIPLDSLNNLVVNFEAGAGSPGLEVSNYFVKKGADGSLEQKRGDEYWLVVFNPNIIKKVEVVNPKTITKNFNFILPLNESDYKGDHDAPDKTNGSPLYNVSNAFADFYSPTVYRDYGGYSEFDRFSIEKINLYKNKPDSMVDVYRAVPKFVNMDDFNKNKEILNTIKYYKKLIDYTSTYGFPPMKDRKASDMFHDMNYNKENYVNKLSSEIESLKNKVISPPKKLKINPGDWVTLNRKYADAHGRSTLNGNYIIIHKEVPAKHLYTDGNSVNEFGYDPS